MNIADHAELRKRHAASPVSDWEDEEVYPCRECAEVHPCAVVRLLDEVDELRAGLERVGRGEATTTDDLARTRYRSDVRPDEMAAAIALATLARADAIGGGE